jgi:hypothetical protein
MNILGQFLQRLRTGLAELGIGSSLTGFTSAAVGPCASIARLKREGVGIPPSLQHARCTRLTLAYNAS